MADDTPTDDERTAYEPWNTHYCDGYIVYDGDDTLTLDFSKGDQTYELTGTCGECGRSLTIVLAVETEMVKTIDRDTGEVLHEY